MENDDDYYYNKLNDEAAKEFGIIFGYMTLGTFTIFCIILIIVRLKEKYYFNKKKKNENNNNNKLVDNSLYNLQPSYIKKLILNTTKVNETDIDTIYNNLINDETYINIEKIKLNEKEIIDLIIKHYMNYKNHKIHKNHKNHSYI